MPIKETFDVPFDFSRVDNGELTLYELTQILKPSVADLRTWTNESLDTILTIIGAANDAQVAHIPHDPDAHDPYAPAELQHIGWSLAHLVLHVTASAEEGAAVASVLARGIPYTREPRLRYEPDWQPVTTRAQVMQRLEESRRMRLAFLDTFPDEPLLDVFQEVSEKFLERFGKMNAMTRFLFGLKHEMGHYDQLREAARQAREIAVAGD